MKLWKTIELILGVIILLIGLVGTINLIGIFQIFGFEYAYTSTGGFNPIWIYTLGFIAAGIAFIWDSFNKKNKFDFNGTNYKRVK